MRTYDFKIDPGLKQKLLLGMDDIAQTLAERELIETFEAAHRQRQPWLFRDRKSTNAVGGSS